MLVEDSTDDIFTLMEGSSADRAGFCEFMRKLNQIYDDLIVDRLEDYNGTLDFFVVSEKARGQRIGKKLWNELLAYFEENQAKSIYVYTDSSCNFGFYDYNGFKRVATQDLIMNSEGNDECTEIYLYDYQL